MPAERSPRKQSRIAIVCLSPGEGGMELDAVRTAKLLSRSAKIVLLIRRGGFLDRARESLLSGYKIHVEVIGFRLNYSLPMIVAARRFLRAHAVTHVICFGNSELKSMFLAFIGLGLTVVVRHGTTKHRPKRDLFHRLIYRQVRWHVVISRHLARNVAAVFPVAREADLRLIYPSLPPLPAEDFRSPAGTVRVIHVGRICHGKGQDAAVLACARAAQAGIDLELTLVGNAPDDQAKLLRELIAQSGISDRVRITGHVENVYPHLRSADIFLFPSLAEGFGNALAEALGVGPVPIVYNNTGLTEIMNLGFYGHLVPDKDEGALAGVLLKVCRDIKTEKRRAYANVALARKLFSQEREKREYLRLLNIWEDLDEEQLGQVPTDNLNDSAVA